MELLSHEVLKILKIDRRTLNRWDKQGILKARRVGPLKIRVFDKNEVMKLLKILPKARGQSVHLLKKKENIIKLNEGYVD